MYLPAINYALRHWQAGDIRFKTSGRLTAGRFEKHMETNELERRRQIIESLRLKRKRFFDSVDLQTYQSWKDDCIEKISSKYTPDEKLKYSLYHVFIGGNDQLNCEFFDFAGEESVQKMIEDLPA